MLIVHQTPTADKPWKTIAVVESTEATLKRLVKNNQMWNCPHDKGTWYAADNRYRIRVSQ
jgi:hypothetical protein